MRSQYAPQRIPLASREPLVSFAVIRLLIAVTALLALAILGFPYGGAVGAVIGALVLPWSVAVLAITRRSPDAGMSPLVVLGDIALLGVLQAVEPELYAAIHFASLFFVAAHAHFQGSEWSIVVGILPPLVLIPVTLATDVPVDEGLQHAYEAAFAALSLLTALVVGALRTAESSGRLRARELSRRMIDTESELRRRLSEAIHDGPIQELSSAELMLASAEQALATGDEARGREALREARELARSNIAFLRDEIVELGPHAFEELSFGQAVADCLEVWQRRYGVDIETDIADERLAPEMAGLLFRITQEAVTNAGKHADASTIRIRLRCEPRAAHLEVEDDGRGFNGVDPLQAGEPGHIGVESMRERAELLGGELSIDSGDRGTRVRVRAPL